MPAVVQLNVQQDPEKPIEKNVLAKAIIDISNAATKLTRSGLNEDAIVILVAEKSNLGRGVVRDVLRSIAHLERNFCK